MQERTAALSREAFFSTAFGIQAALTTQVAKAVLFGIVYGGSYTPQLTQKCYPVCVCLYGAF